MAQDCLERHNPEAVKRAMEKNQQMDSEYNKLMRELDGSSTVDDASVPGGNQASTNSIPPWRRPSAQQGNSGSVPGGQQVPQPGWGADGGQAMYDASAYYGTEAYMDPAYMAWAQQQWAQQGYAGYAAPQ
jgi:hypothetical protein